MIGFLKKRNFKYCYILLIIIKYFSVSGYWRPAIFDKNIFTKIIYHTWTVIWSFWYLGTLLIVQTLAVYMYWPDFSKVSGALFILLTNLLHIMKLINLVYRRDLISSHIKYFQTTNYGENQNDPEIIQIIQNWERISVRDYVFYNFIAFINCMGWGAVGDTNGDPWGFPLIAWYPFNTSYSPIYQFVYVHQFVAEWIAAVYCLTIDTVATNTCIQICCQFDLIKKHLRDTEKTEKYNGVLVKIPDEIVYPKLVKIINRHSEIINICKELNTTIGWTVFVQFGVSSLNICITLYQFVVITDQNRTTKIAVIAYMVSLTIQLFLYCYYGNQIIVLSLSIADEIGNISWYSFSNKSRKALNQMLQKTQQPLIIRAGGLMPLSLETFTSIMKASYSFFNVIQNMK